MVIRILLVERMSLLREALAAVLSTEDDLEVSAAIAGVDGAGAVGHDVKPDVAVIDVDPPGRPGLTVVQELADALPGCAILMLADPDSPGTVWAALDQHVCSCVSKDALPSRLAECIRRVAAGERVIDPTLAVAALRAPRNPLTAREREVLAIMASGAPSAEIAHRLRLSTGTVCNYISTIIHKTGARNRLEAVRIAGESGWLSEPGHHAPTRSR
jgi:two-component system response regulator DesR